MYFLRTANPVAGAPGLAPFETWVCDQLRKQAHPLRRSATPTPRLHPDLTIRVDHDVVEWLRKAGSGYQTRINAILRSYMKAQSE